MIAPPIPNAMGSDAVIIPMTSVCTAVAAVVNAVVTALAAPSDVANTPGILFSSFYFLFYVNKVKRLVYTIH